MKSFTLLLILIFSVYGLQLFLPWWILTVLCFVGCFVYKPGLLLSFSICFISVFLVWFVRAWYVDSGSGGNISIITGRLLGDISPSLVLFATAFTGALAGGLSGLSGAIVNELWLKKSLV